MIVFGWTLRGLTSGLVGEGLRAVEDVHKPPGSLLATDSSKAVVLVYFLLNIFGVGVSCRIFLFFCFLFICKR